MESLEDCQPTQTVLQLAVVEKQVHVLLTVTVPIEPDGFPSLRRRSRLDLRRSLWPGPSSAPETLEWDIRRVFREGTGAH